jgi:hypothetical protein
LGASVVAAGFGLFNVASNALLLIGSYGITGVCGSAPGAAVVSTIVGVTITINSVLLL